METKKVDPGNAYRLLGHGPTVLVSTYDGEYPNASAVAWTMPVSKEPPRFAMRIGEGHKTYKNLMESKCCVINIPTAEHKDKVILCGTKSGNTGDKLGPAGIGTIPSKKLSAPRLDFCAAWMECELIGNLELNGTNLVLVEAKLIECIPGAMDADDHWNAIKFPTLHHLGGSSFSVPGRVMT